MGGKLKAKTEEEASRIIKGLTRTQTRAKVDAETGIPGAGKQMEKMAKQIAALKKKVAGHQKTINKLWVWKMAQEMKDVKPIPR